ncbi:MAG: glycosyltransferase family 2 protein [Thermodesulfobacteriota bacterium]|nr:glycosyltransferase family 2 protein [Thermodesulfobacteriota bacterium]
MKRMITFVILTWNSEKYIVNCFNSIISKCEEEDILYEIIAIDNGSTDGTLSILKSYEERYPHELRKVILTKNMGTTYPRNLGLKKGSGEYFCLLDSDTKILCGSLSQMIKRFDKGSEIGIIAPQLLLPNGKVQNSVKKFPTFWQKFSKVPSAMLKLKTPQFDFYENFPFESETFVDTAISAGWFFHRDIIELVGFFDEKIFYAPEDLDYCVRLRQSGKKIIYFPHFKILHNTQQISHKKPFSILSVSHFLGLLYYFKKHGGWFSTKALSKQFEQ